MPVTAEWTIITRAPEASRSRVTLSMLRQLGSDDTRVPPNFRTIHAEGVRVTDLSSQRTPRRTKAEAVASFCCLGLGKEPCDQATITARRRRSPEDPIRAYFP